VRPGEVAARTYGTYTLAALIDVIGGVVNWSLYSPVFGERGERAAITSDGASEAFPRMMPAGANWENKVLSRSFLHMPLYMPRRGAHRISVPTLFIAARRDKVVPASAACRVARRIPNCTFHLLDASHFEPYFGDHFERNIALQLDFLREHVPVDR
jgi:pimeloyl-ACP methyl ester carboxylesterase